MKKQILRAKAKNIRENLNVKFCSEKINFNVSSWDLYKKAKNIMLYYPINSEISLLGLLKDKEKSFFFPVVEGENMFPVEYDCVNGFQEGRFNIKEPVGEECKDINLIDLILIPALAADLKGNRLGYGKGYYDRFIESLSPETLKTIVISDELLFDEIPTELHDKKCDYIITESLIREIKY